MNKADKYLKETISEILENGSWEVNPRIGERKEMNCGDVCEIVEYYTSENITVKFEGNNELLKNKSYYNFLKGSIKNRYRENIYDRGYIGVGKYTYSNSTRGYIKWHGILDRCYGKHFLEKSPTYKECYVDKRWYNFQEFAKWFECNWKPHMEGWHLDKDILIKGNKVYSPDTCCFVPFEINSLLIKNNKNRGEYPIGVKKVKSNNFSSRLNNTHLGTFKTSEEAFQAYKIAKEQYIKVVIDKWKDLIDPRVYEAMYNYQVEIDD